MIVDAILGFLVDAAAAIIGLIPEWTPPSWVADNIATGYAADIGGWASGFAYWVPLSLLATVVSAVLAVYLLVVGVRLALWVWSKVPVVGS